MGLLVVCLLLSLHGFSQGVLKAEFYSGKNFEKYVSTQSMENIDLYWETKSPVLGMDPGKCSIRWTGSIKPPISGEYRFSARVDYGLRLWINDDLVIDDWTLHDWGRLDGKIHLDSDVLYDFKVEYFNAMFGGEIRLMWDLPPSGNVSKDETQTTIIDSKYFHEIQEQKKDASNEGSEKILASNNSAAVPSEKRRKNKRILRNKNTPVVVSNPSLLVGNEKASKKSIPRTYGKEEMTPKVIDVYKPQSVQFERAKAQILEKSKEDLDVLAEFLMLNSYLYTEIEGHTDLAGDPQKNMKLSERRAYAVARYLVKRGVESSQIDAKGMGGSKPLIQSSGKLYHPENRRVSFVISVP